MPLQELFHIFHEILTLCFYVVSCRQRQKARQPPRQPSVETKQTSPSASHPSQQLAHVIEEFSMLSDMEPALSPLPPSPDREALGDSSSSEEESGSGSSSEDDGSGNEDEDSDYSLGDLADMLIGDHDEGENLAASPMKTRSSDQDFQEDVENSTGQETTTKNDADCAKTENESSVRQSPNEASASDIEVSENLSHENCNIANPRGETSKCLSTTQEGTCSIEAEMNENSHITESDGSDRKKTDEESAKTKEPSNIEKCTVVTPSPQRKAKPRMASSKPRVMTRSRAKAMKLSSSSDAESSSERETGMEVNSTQENSSEVSDTDLKRDSNASDIGKSNDGGSGNNENVSSVALVDNMKEFTESSQANESVEHAKGNFQDILPDSSNTDADDGAHHHGNLCEPVCLVASFSDLKDQEPTEDNSAVLLVGVEADVIHSQTNDGERSCSGALGTDSEEQAGNEGNSNVLLIGMDTDAVQHQKNDGQLSRSRALLSGSEKQEENESNSNVLSVGVDKDVNHQQKNDGQLSCSSALLTDSEEQAGNEDSSNVFTGGQEVDGSKLSHSTASLSEQVAYDDDSDVSPAPTSEAAANVPTEVGIEVNQEISTTSECGSRTKGDAPLNMTREQNADINEIPSLELNNDNADSILANKIISEINTEESQTSQDSKITADVNGNTVLSQLEAKENAFERREDTLEENNNNISEDFESAPEQLEDDSALVVDTDSSDQTQPFVRKTPNRPICTTKRKSTDVSELSTTFDGTKNEDRSTEQVYVPSDEETDADSFPCVVPGKATTNKFVETSKGEPVYVSSSTVEVDLNLSTLTCEKETTMTTASTTETTECSSTTSHEVETSEDCKLALEEDDHSHVSDEAMQSCSIDEREGKDSKGQDSSVQENIPVLTSESSGKNSELEKDESLSSDGEQFSTCNEGGKYSDCVKGVPASKTAIEEASEPSTSTEGRKNSDCVKDVPASKTVIEDASEPSTSKEGRKNSDCVKDVPSFKTVIEEASKPSTSSEGRNESDSERDMSSRAMTRKRSSTSTDENRHFDTKEDLSSRVTGKERSSLVNEGRKHSDMGRVVSSIGTRKESCLTFDEGKNNSPLGRDVSSRADLTSIQRKKDSALENLSSRAMNKESSSTFNEGKKHADVGRVVPSTGTKRERNSALERNVSSGEVGNESPSTFNMRKRNSDLGREVSPRIISKEGSSSNEKEIPSNLDVREPSTFDETRKRYAIKRDVSSPRTLTEKAGERKRPSSSQLDAEESKLGERGQSLELPWFPNNAGPSDDSPALCDPEDDSPIQALFNNLECLLEEFPSLSPLPPSPCPSDDEECLASQISSSNLNKEKSNRVTDLTFAKKTFDVRGKPEFKRDQELNYTEVASRSVKRTSLRNSATMCITESNKLNISVTPRNCLAKDKTSKSASTSCSGGSASTKPPLQRSASAPPRAEEKVSLKRSYQQSVSEPVNNKIAVAQKSKKMKTQPKIPHKEETSSLENRLGISRVPVEKATFSQPSKKNGVTKGPVLVSRKGPILADSKEPKLAGNKGPIQPGTKVPILAGKKEPKVADKKEPKLAGNKGPILAGSKETVLVGDHGPLLEFNERPVLEEESKNTNNSAKSTGNKQSKYRPLSVRPGYMPEVKYVFKCLSRVYEDNVDLHIVVERLTTKRCISSSTPVVSAIIQFLKEREDDLVPQILDQLEHFQTDASPNNWQPVISSFESRLLEVISLLSNDTLFGNLIPRLVSLCSRSLTEARCSSNDEEVMRGDLSLW